MSNYSERNNAALAVALRRQYLSPLDVSSVFKCLADFEAYVTRNSAYTNSDYETADNEFLQKINPYSYPGQIVAVLDEENNTAKAYVINKCGALAEGENIADRYSEVGKSIDVDTKTIEIKNGVLMLAGLSNVPAERTKAYQPTLDANGKLVWSPVSETTVEGLQTLVSALQERVSAIENKESAWDGAVTDVAAIKAKYIKEVAYAEDTGVFTFTLQDGTTKTVDLAIEKVVTNFVYDTENKNLVLTLADGSTQEVPMTAFIDDYTVEKDALQIQLAISSDNEISATIVDGSITEVKLSSGITEKLAQIQDGVDAKAALADKADKTVVDGLAIDNTANKADIESLQTAVAEKVGEDEVNDLIAAASIDGNKVTGAVANATKAASATSADKTVGKLQFGDKEFDGSALQTLLASDLGALTPALIKAGSNITVSTDPGTNEVTISAQEAEDNRRVVKVDGTEKLAVDSKGALNLAGGANVTLVPVIDESGNLTVTVQATDTKYTAGDGIEISDANVIALKAKSVDTEAIADSAITNEKIESVNVSKLAQTDDEILILDGGQA